MDTATTLPFEPAGDIAAGGQAAATPSPLPVLQKQKTKADLEVLRKKLPLEGDLSGEARQPKIEEISDDDVEMPPRTEASGAALEPSEMGQQDDCPEELFQDPSSPPVCSPSAEDSLDVALAAEAASLAEPLQSPQEDMRKKQLAIKVQNREAAAAKKKQQELEKEQKAAAKAAAKEEKKRLRAEKASSKAATKKLKNGKPAPEEDQVEPAPESSMAAEAALEDYLSEPAADGEGEDQAAAEEVEAVEAEVKTKRRSRKASAKAKGRPRKSSEPAGSSSAAGAPSSSAPAADNNAKKPKTIRRGGQSDVINKSLVQELSIYMKQWRNVPYRKEEHTVHKGVPGMTPYWSRDAAGIKVDKQDGSGKFQACYFALQLDKCSSMAVNLYLAKKFLEKCSEEAPGWAEGSEAGVHYGILARSAKMAHDKLK